MPLPRLNAHRLAVVAAEHSADAGSGNSRPHPCTGHDAAGLSLASTLACGRKERSGRHLDVDHGVVARQTQSHRRTDVVASWTSDGCGVAPGAVLCGQTKWQFRARESPAETEIRLWVCQSEPERAFLRSAHGAESGQLYDEASVAPSQYSEVYREGLAFERDELGAHASHEDGQRKVGVSQKRNGLPHSDTLTVGRSSALTRNKVGALRTCHTLDALLPLATTISTNGAAAMDVLADLKTGRI